jgi:signal transduction histidine kinase
MSSIKAERLMPLAEMAGALLILSATLAAAEQPSNWRIFRAADGLRDSYISSVTVSPRGNVWVKHGEVNEISVLNGYSINTFPSPGTNSYRVYESVTGQMWTLHPDGLLVHDGNRWILHSIPEIRSEIQSAKYPQIFQVPLVPAQRHHVFFLLSSRLMEYDSLRRSTTMIKNAADTGLGKFLEMSEARDDSGLWITGTNGLGKIAGPLRSLKADSPWEEYLVRNAGNLQRPFENDRGEITTVAKDSSAAIGPFILRFGGSSRFPHPVAGEPIRQAWPGWDETTWGYTINSLLRFDNDRDMTLSRERLSFPVGQFKDVATETNGVFWLATSEGLVRYAPFPWRTPRDIEAIDSLVHAIMEDAQGRLWFASTDFLIQFAQGRWKRIKWPEGFEADFQTTDSLYQLPDGQILAAARDRPLLFDPVSEEFRFVIHGAGRKIKFIGQAKSGKLSAQTSQGSFTDSYHLEQFDGTNFTAVIESQPDWNLGGELFFLTVAQNGDVWIGGAGGLGVVRDDQLQVFGPAQGFFEERALCMLDLGNGRIWCGGTDRIQEFNGQSWSLVRSGMDRVNSMTRAKDGKIWVATARGLYGYSDGSWIMNGVEEGLPSAALSKILQDRQGRLWAGTTRGISLYHPDADTSPPKTLLPSVSASARPRTEGPVTLVFNAVDKWHYTPAHRLLFSYRLDEGQWSPYTNTLAKTFDNLRPGKHRFESRAMDRNWNFDPNPASVEFTVIVPWYKESRLIVILICGLALVLFFAGLAVNRHVQLIRSYAEVEKNVRLRTRELERANQELLHSQKMKALGTLAAGIAHDFNNILSIIKGSAQIIESNVEDKDKIRTRVSRIKTVVDQGSGIVKSMLGLSRVTAQDFVLCDVNSVVDDTIKVLGDRFPQEVSVQFESAPSLPAILGVRELIQQMLLNLILNAADAISGAGEIVVKTGQLNMPPDNLALSPSAAPSCVYITVQDNGCGIPPDVLPRIFEPFFTTKAFSTRRGTGLGLSMVYELAKEMGYGLKVKSVVGKGSTFSILMPVGR